MSLKSGIHACFPVFYVILMHTDIKCSNLHRGDKKGWHVFYHFVGAVPGSTDLKTMLSRLLKEANVVNVRKYLFILS